MSTTDPTTDAPDAPRLLLFGPPGTGKSSLLGALLQASDTRPAALGARVDDPSGRIAMIRDHVYGDLGLAVSQTELVTYHLRLTPDGYFFVWRRMAVRDQVVRIMSAYDLGGIYPYEAYTLVGEPSVPTFDQSGEYMYVPLPSLDEIQTFQ